MKRETIEEAKKNAPKDFSYHINETGDYRDTWRIFRIMSEFVEGYQFLSSLKKEVTILGSARTKEDEKFYQIAMELGALLGKGGYTTITGGGPGIMEAANRGAHGVGGESLGLNIQLPFEQRINPYVTKSIAFYYFFTRKVMMTSPAHAFVYFPGGFGTLDEFFEVVNHMELGKMCYVPIVLVGREYWQPIVDFIKSNACELVGSVEQRDLGHWKIVDTAEEAYEALHAAEQETDYKSCELSAMNFHSNTKNVDWRVFRIMAELVEGFEFLTGLVEDVTVLGTKSLNRDSTYYAQAHELGRLLKEDGYAVVTGGGSGVAEAANKGCMEAGGQSYGIGMEVGGKLKMNSYLTKSISFKFPFTRKLIVTAPSKAFVFFPGGFGTMHHLFEVLTLIQTEKLERVPIILIDHEFWGPLHAFIKKIFVHKYETVSDEDDELYQIVDSVDAAIKIINDFRNK